MNLRSIALVKNHKYKVSVLLIVIIVGGYYVFSGNTEMNKLAYFERISGIKFPDKLSIEDYDDNGEFYVRVLLSIDSLTMNSMISKYHVKRLNLPTDPALPGYEKSFIEQINTFFKNNRITRKNNLYYVDSCTRTNRIMYVFDKMEGKFWGMIQYPDWSGDAPCGNR